MNTVFLILGMFLVTFGVRYPPLALVGRLQLRDEIVRGLRYVPVAVLTAITVPYMLYRDGALTLSLQNSYLVGGIVAIAISYWTKNLLVTIGLGLMLFFGYRMLLGL